MCLCLRGTPCRGPQRAKGAASCYFIDIFVVHGCEQRKPARVGREPRCAVATVVMSSMLMHFLLALAAYPLATVMASCVARHIAQRTDDLRQLTTHVSWPAVLCISAPVVHVVGREVTYMLSDVLALVALCVLSALSRRGPPRTVILLKLHELCPQLHDVARQLCAWFDHQAQRSIPLPRRSVRIAARSPSALPDPDEDVLVVDDDDNDGDDELWAQSAEEDST